MKLPIRNRMSKPLVLIIEPLGEDHTVPPGGEAVVSINDGELHSIDVSDDHIIIWDEGSFDTTVAVADKFTL